MTDVYEVLRKKELDFRRMQKDVVMLRKVLWQVELEFQRVEKEIAALRSVIPLLAEDTTELDLPDLPRDQANKVDGLTSDRRGYKVLGRPG